MRERRIEQPVLEIGAAEGGCSVCRHGFSPAWPLPVDARAMNHAGHALTAHAWIATIAPQTSYALAAAAWHWRRNGAGEPAAGPACSDAGRCAGCVTAEWAC